MKTMIIAVLFAAAGTASAAPTGTNVQTDWYVGNTSSGFGQALAGGTSNLSTSPFDLGTDLGNSMGGASVMADYVVTSPGAGPNGGVRYDIGVRLGSRTSTPVGADFYLQSLGGGGTMSNGDVVDEMTIEFGVGGGGIAFDDFGAATTVAITTDQGTFAKILNASPGAASIDDTNPGFNAQWFINPDGTLGFDWTFDAYEMWLSQTDLTPHLAGDFFGSFPVSGISSTVIVEVLPAPGSLALLGLSGLGIVRRRR